MAKHSDRLRADRLTELRSDLKFTQETLAAAVRRAGGKLSQQQVVAIEKGDVKRPGSLTEIARVLHTTADYLLGKTDNPARPMNIKNDSPAVQKPQLHGFVRDVTIPVWQTLPGGGRMGEVVLREKHVDSIARPLNLIAAVEALGFIILDAFMDPAFRIGDIAYVNPAGPASPGDDCLLVRILSDGPERQYLALARYLVSDTLTHWLVRQFDPRDQYELPKADWPECWKICGKYSR
jgi:transcriptional regulator with XRE-family HTH domain